jgi:steroid delta-isomerase-like uncharacterized protein
VGAPHPVVAGDSRISVLRTLSELSTYLPGAAPLILQFKKSPRIVPREFVSYQEKEIQMSKEANLATAQKMGEAVVTGKLEILREVFAPDAIDHDPAPDQVQGAEGYIHFFTQLRRAFPDLNLSIEHLVVDEDNIAFAYTITGTHQGTFQGIPPTGKKIKARGMQISKFNANALIQERWGSSDELGILLQLGATIA